MTRRADKKLAYLGRGRGNGANHRWTADTPTSLRRIRATSSRSSTTGTNRSRSTRLTHPCERPTRPATSDWLSPARLDPPTPARGPGPRHGTAR
jgi:hypothetical protein